MEVKVGVLDEHDLIRIAVRDILTQSQDIELVGIFASMKALVDHGQVVDVLLLGDRLSDTDIFEAMARLREQYPTLKIIVLGQQWSRAQIQAALECGALGFIDKSESLPDLLVSGIRHVKRGVSYVSPEAGSRCAQPDPPEICLTPRELEVLQFMVELTPKQIGAALNLSRRTVYDIQTRLREKFDVRTNAQVIAEAIRRGRISGS